MLMRKMKPFTAASFLTCAAVLAGWAMPARAGAMDDRVPADSVLYVGWAGADTLGDQYNASNLKKILDASPIGEFLNKELPGIITQATNDDPEAAKHIAQVQRGLNIAWKHPTAFYFCPVDLANPRKPGVRFGLICEAGADAKALHDMLLPAVQQVPPTADVQVKLTMEAGHVLLAFGKPDTLADLKAGGGLAGVPAYAKAMAQVKGSGQAVSVYGDIQKTIAMVNEALVKADAPAEARMKVPAVINALGLNGFTQISMQAGFNGKNWSERAFIGVNGPRTGVLSLADGGPLSDGVLALVPKDAAVFSASRFDLQKLWGEARKVIQSVEPRALEQMDREIAKANQELQINIEKDVVGALGDEWVVYRAPVGESGLGFTLVNKARDGAALARAIDTLEKLFNAQGDLPIKIEKVKAAKMDVSALMFMQYNVAWTVRNGYLYVSTLNGIAAAVNQVEKQGPSIATSDLYQGVVASLLPAGVKPTAVAYSHPARLYPELRTLAMGFLPLLRSQGKIPVPMDLLPDPTEVSEFMTPGGTVTWSDAEGFHGAGTSAFPGAVLLGGQQPGGTTFAGAGALGLGLFGWHGARTARHGEAHAVQPQAANVDLP